jgi:hypothetical protein
MIPRLLKILEINDLKQIRENPLFNPSFSAFEGILRNHCLASYLLDHLCDHCDELQLSKQGDYVSFLLLTSFSWIVMKVFKDKGLSKIKVQFIKRLRSARWLKEEKYKKENQEFEYLLEFFRLVGPVNVAQSSTDLSYEISNEVIKKFQQFILKEESPLNDSTVRIKELVKQAFEILEDSDGDIPSECSDIVVGGGSYGSIPVRSSLQYILQDEGVLLCCDYDYDFDTGKMSSVVSLYDLRSCSEIGERLVLKRLAGYSSLAFCKGLLLVLTALSSSFRLEYWRLDKKSWNWELKKTEDLGYGEQTDFFSEYFSFSLLPIKNNELLFLNTTVRDSDSRWEIISLENYERSPLPDDFPVIRSAFRKYHNPLGDDHIVSRNDFETINIAANNLEEKKKHGDVGAVLWTGKYYCLRQKSKYGDNDVYSLVENETVFQENSGSFPLCIYENHVSLIDNKFRRFSCFYLKLNISIFQAKGCVICKRLDNRFDALDYRFQSFPILYSSELVMICEKNKRTMDDSSRIREKCEEIIIRRIRTLKEIYFPTSTTIQHRMHNPPSHIYDATLVGNEFQYLLAGTTDTLYIYDLSKGCALLLWSMEMKLRAYEKDRVVYHLFEEDPNRCCFLGRSPGAAGGVSFINILTKTVISILNYVWPGQKSLRCYNKSQISSFYIINSQRGSFCFLFFDKNSSNIHFKIWKPDLEHFTDGFNGNFSTAYSYNEETKEFCLTYSSSSAGMKYGTCGKGKIDNDYDDGATKEKETRVESDHIGPVRIYCYYWKFIISFNPLSVNSEFSEDLFAISPPLYGYRVMSELEHVYDDVERRKVYKTRKSDCSPYNLMKKEELSSESEITVFDEIKREFQNIDLRY